MLHLRCAVLRAFVCMHLHEGRQRRLTTQLFRTVLVQVAADEKVTIMGFGSWERRQRAARTGRNPKTGEALQIPASFAPGFSAGKSFKDRVNGKPKAVKALKEVAPKKAAGTAAPKAPKAPKAAPKTAAKSASAAPSPAAKPKPQQK